MKRAINIFTIITIIFSLFLLISRFSLRIAAPVTSPESGEQKIVNAFADFPPDKQKIVEIEIDEDTLNNFSEREKKDQVLDWLLYTTVYSIGMTAEALSESLYDLPPIRYGYMHPVANFEFGDTRSCVIGDSSIIALVSQDIPEDRYKDYLAAIVDKHRKDLGGEPKTIHLFRYKINLKGRYALLTRCRDVKTDALFTEEYGYYTSTIKNLDDFKRFMGKIEDITYAEVASDGLKLGGRKLKEPYRGLQVEDVAAIWQAEKKNQESTGFSLDPTYDFKGLQKYFSDPERLFETISSFGSKLIKKEEFQKAAKALRNNDIVPLLEIFDKLKKCDNDRAQVLALIFEGLVQRHRFQTARYDGPLQGTEVGMVLFYTDLLAKLWALDYQDSISSKDIENFIPITATKVSPIYKQELLELPETRLWFGTNDKGFQKVGNCNQLLFARIAARVYAASSNPLQPGEEVAPNAKSAAFLGWWNDHYEEIARYEPEYQRLNEIMKWSILIAWLNNVDKGYYLYFLQDVKVCKGNWFTEWVKSQPNLKFKKWDKVEFYKPGYLGTSTEAMAILYSRKYEQFGLPCTLSGGVSLARKNLLKERPPLSTKINKPMRRSGSDYAKTTIESDFKIVHTFDGQIFKLENITPTMVLVIATPKEGAKLRGLHSAIRPQEVTHNILLNHSGLVADSKIDKNPLGQFKISDSKNDFKIGWKSRDIDAGQELARKMSKVQNPTDVLLNEPGIESIIRQGEDRFYIKFKSSETWVKIDRERTSSPEIPYVYHAKVSDIDGGIKNYQLKWLEPSALGSEMRSGSSEYITIGPFNNTGKEMIDVSPTRGPPSTPFEIDYRHFRITACIDSASGEIFIKRDFVPYHFWETPDKLQKVVKNDIPIILVKARQHPGDIIRLDRTNSPDPDSVEISLRNGDYGKAAKEIVQNPQRLKSILSNHFRYELSSIKEFLDAGQYSQAEGHLEELMATYGPRPELKIYKTLIFLQRHIEADKTFFDVLTDGKITNLEKYCQELTFAMENAAIKPKPNMKKNKIETECTLAENVELESVTETEIDNINRDKPPIIYIHDDPNLNNFDWPSAVRTGSLRQAIPGLEITKIHESNVSTIKPDKIIVPAETIREAYPERKASPLVFVPPSFYHFIPFRPDDDDDDDENDIYLIFLIPRKK